MHSLAGVDGCRGGWIAAVGDSDGPVSIFVRPHFADIAQMLCPNATIAVDMPIGLPERLGPEGRAPERLVRPLLGSRQSSVFAVPARCAIYAGVTPRLSDERERYRHACAVARSASEPARAVSKQAFNLFPRIVELDRYLRRRTEGSAVHEAHPEVAFWAMNGDRALDEPKKVRGTPWPAGIALRRELLRAAGLPTAAIDAAPPPGAAIDDLLDALATLVVARDIAAGRGRVFPDPPGQDGCGLPIGIWTAARCP